MKTAWEILTVFKVENTKKISTFLYILHNNPDQLSNNFWQFYHSPLSKDIIQKAWCIYEYSKSLKAISFHILSIAIVAPASISIRPQHEVKETLLPWIQVAAHLIWFNINKSKSQVKSIVYIHERTIWIYEVQHIRGDPIILLSTERP